MAAFNVKASLQKIESYLAASGYCRAGVQVGEPKAPPTDGSDLYAAIFMQRAGVVALTLQTTIELHVIMCRFYRNMLTEPTSGIEYQLAEALSKVTEDLLGDFDLGATVRKIDAGGEYGTPLGAEWGYVDVSGKMFRVADLVLPLVVDDSSTTTA